MTSREEIKGSLPFLTYFLTCRTRRNKSIRIDQSLVEVGRLSAEKMPSANSGSVSTYNLTSSVFVLIFHPLPQSLQDCLFVILIGIIPNTIINPIENIIWPLVSVFKEVGA